MTENFMKFYRWTKTFDKQLVEYNKDKLLNGCRPFREGKTNLENGVYLTIRAGLGGNMVTNMIILKLILKELIRKYV